MRTVECLNPNAAEDQFNVLVNEGVRDYKALLDFIPKQGTIFDNAVMGKFNDLLNLCIEIKKKEAIEALESAEAQPQPKAAKPNRSRWALIYQ